MKIKKGDKIQVISGKDKGKTGEVQLVLRKLDKVVVTGINIVKKHEKKNETGDKKGGIIAVEAPIHVSNVQILDPNKNKPARVGFKMEKDKKVRITKKYNSVLK